MLNYVAAYVLTYLIFNSQSYWRETESFNATVFPTASSCPTPDLADLDPRSGGIVLPLGAGLAVRRGLPLVPVLADALRLRGPGDRRLAARGALRGHATRRKILAVMASPARSPASAARARSATSGTRSTRRAAAPCYGYAGIVVAALARYNPIAVVPVAV